MSLDLALTWSDTLGGWDWTLAGPDLATDAGLRAAIIVSLGTDRLALPDDVIPDATDRRGWWGDTPISPAATPDPIGSRLWLLQRAKATEETRQRAIAYAQEALAWLIADGIAARVDIQAALNPPGLPPYTLTLTVRIIRTQGSTAGNPVFDSVWSHSFTA